MDKTAKGVPEAQNVSEDAKEKHNWKRVCGKEEPEGV